MKSQEGAPLIPKADASRVSPVAVSSAWRWPMLTFYFLLTVANAMVFTTFGPIDVTTGCFFGEDVIWVNLQTGIGTVFGLILMLPTMYAVQRFSLRPTFLFAGVVNAISGLIRMGVGLFHPYETAQDRSVYFWLVFVSQFVAMLSNPLLTSVIPEISAHWFPVAERSVATSVGSLATLVGLASGYALSGFLIGNEFGTGGGGGGGLGNNCTVGLDAAAATAVPILEDFAQRFRWLFMSQGAGLFVTSLLIFFFRDGPNFDREEQKHHRFFSDLRECLRTRALVVMILLFGIGYGLFVAVWSTMQSVVNDSATWSAWIGITMVGAGVVSAAIAGIIIDKYRCYKLMLTVGAGGGAICFALFFFALRNISGLLVYSPRDLAWLLGSGAGVGFFAIAMLPICFECAAEVTFPINEAFSGGLLVMSGNGFGIIFIVFFSIWTESVLWVLLALVCFFVVSLMLLFLFRPTYKRLLHEQQQTSGVQ